MSKAARLTDTDVRALGWQALVERLGPSGALRFAIQTERGYGDYAHLRHRMLGSRSVDDLLAAMRARGQRPVKRGPKLARRRR